MSVGYLFVQSLQAAGKDLTREGLIEAVERAGSPVPVLTPLRYSKDDHSGYGGVRMSKVTGKISEYFGPTYSTDDGDTPVTELTGEPTAPPADGIPTK